MQTYYSITLNYALIPNSRLQTPDLRLKTPDSLKNFQKNEHLRYKLRQQFY